MAKLWQLLAKILIQAFSPNAIITMALDDTLFHHSGRKVNGAGWWRDAGSPSFNLYTRHSYIGAAWNTNIFFDGVIDEVMIFDRALQEEEIEAIYNGANQGNGMIVSYEYDTLSARISARYGNGTSAEYYYDMADRLLGLDNQTDNGNLSYDYSYDNVGNRLTMLVNGTDLHNYTYDNIYQLTEVDYPEDSFTDDTSFIYDAAGNRWQVTGGGLGPYYATNILNQYTSASTVYFSYDDNGNLTGDGTDSYTYDAENRLITANASALSITYSYDPSGRRISKTVGDETTYYIYDGDQVICEYDSAGNLRKKFLYGVGIDEVVRMSQVGRTADIWGPANEPDGTVDIYDLRKMSEAWLKNEGDDGFNADADLNYDGKINNTDSDILSANWLSNDQLSEVYFYYHYDGLGSVIAVSDSVGRVVEKYQYAVYGNPLILNQYNKQLTESKYGNPYMFTGRRFDTETRLYYYRARYYSTEIGRFLQVDPIGYEDSMNLYIYVDNNPIVLCDPYGLWNLRIGFAWFLGGQLNVGHNEGQWSVSLNVGPGLGAIVSYDNTNTGATTAGSGGGINITANLSAEVYKIVSAGVSAEGQGSLGHIGPAVEGDISGGIQFLHFGGVAHGIGAYGPNLNKGGPLFIGTKETVGGLTFGLGAMGFVGGGGHIQWGNPARVPPKMLGPEYYDYWEKYHGGKTGKNIK